MADNLIFPIGFDLQKAVEDASQNWDKKYAKRLEQAIAKRPVRIKLDFEKLEDVKTRLAQLKIQPITPKTRTAIRELAKELQVLAKALDQVQKFSKTTQLGQRNFTNDVQMEKLRQANERLEIQKRRVALAEQKHAEAMQRSATASRQLSSEYQNQDDYIFRLLKRMAVYAGYSMVTNFLTSVRNVTAEFELQRISLGAIIQDQQKANQIFAEIKSFALTSPLKILDLTKYAKQVAAYGFAADRVFDVTKRLADISVGLGVDMGRLTLAVSQIRAATVLKSSELRQLTETGLPMLDLLSKKLTETQGKLVSAADVMDLISKRAISYEMVEEILYDLTDAGGMFYNMQVKQSQTLYGMWSKLGDAAAVMYEQIGNTSSINEGMKTVIHAIELMMRNWKTTAIWIGALTAGIATYTLVLKNAAIASNSVTIAEGARLAITKAQVIATPKLIAAIVGQNVATKLSSVLTRAHTVAMMRQAIATNVLSRAFWGLTAAMLANPWAIAAGLVVAAGFAIYQFASATETAAERAEQLNNSVASLKNLETTTGGLVETYNELSAKTERTAEEQKKLSDVTHELAKQYPGAITAVGNFGEEVELAADKLNKLYQAEKQARMNNTRYELEQTEEKIKETEAEIARLQGVLQKGTKSMTVGGGISGYVQTITVEMSDEDKGKVLQQIDDLLYGEDGQGGLHSLKESAQAAKDALEAALKGITIEELHIERFGAWKKTLTTFKEQVGDIQVRLFEDSTINQFGSLEEALKKTAEEYKKNIALVATYDDVLKSTTLTAEERAKIETERAEADAMANLAEKALKYYNAMSLLNTSTSGRGTKSDNRLQNLQEIERTLTSINKKYEELAKTEGSTAALEYVRKNYDSTLKYINKLGKQFNLNFAMPTDFKDLQSYRKAIQGVIEQLKMKGYEKAAIELELKIAEGNQAQLQKEIQAKLKDLADRISRTKTAREFYEKILNMTGDIQLSANLAVSVYGQNGQDLQDAIREQIKTAFETDPEKNVTIDLSEAIDPDTGAINYNKLAELEEKYKDVLISDRADLRQKLIDEGRKTSAAQAQQWLKDIEKAKDFAQQRIDLATYTANQIAAINARTDLPQVDKDKLTKGYQDREAKQLAKLQYDEFKDSAMYVHIFEDLDHASTTALKNMRDRLIALKGQWQHLDPTQVKELTKAIADLDEQIAGRSPFKSILDGFKGLASARPQKVIDAELLTATEELTQREKALTAATKKYTEAQTAQLNAQAEVAQARQDLEDALAVSGGEETAEVKAAREVLGIKIATFNAIKAASADSISAAKTEVDKASEKYEEQKKVIDKLVEEGKIREANIKKIELANQKIDEYQQQINEALDGIRKMMEAFGASDEDMQFFDDVVGSINEIVDAGQEAAMSVANIMSMNPAQMAQGIMQGISAIGGLVSGFTNLFYAGRVKRANKEIKRQQELLDQLEYTYGRLEKAADKAFGADFVANMNQQHKVLQAQAAAYQKQYEAELSKGKKADEERLKEYQEAYRDTLDKIADMQGKFAERMAGTDVASAAREFAQAWLEAYASFGDTVGAMKEKFNDLIKNMIVESVMAKTVQMVLQPMFDHMDEMYKSGKSVTDVLKYAFSQAAATSQTISDGLEVNAHILESLGFNVRDLYATSDNLTGISRDIATASEKDINGLAAHMSTVEYYASTVPGMASDVAAIRVLLEGGAARTSAQSDGFSSIDYTPMFSVANQHLQSLPRIEEQLGQIYALLNRTMVAKGGKFGFNSFYNS